MTFSAEKLGTRYARPCARVQPAGPSAMGGKGAKILGEKLPMMNRQNVNTAESSGEENDENSSAMRGDQNELQHDEIERHQQVGVAALKCWAT